MKLIIQKFQFRDWYIENFSKAYLKNIFKKYEAEVK